METLTDPGRGAGVIGMDVGLGGVWASAKGTPTTMMNKLRSERLWILDFIRREPAE